jgi:hypothetical protein
MRDRRYWKFRGRTMSRYSADTPRKTIRSTTA